MEILNNYFGLISLIAAVAAIGAIIVPFVIFKKQRKYEAEKEEQAILRKEWIAKFKANFRAQLDNIEFVDKQ